MRELGRARSLLVARSRDTSHPCGLQTSVTIACCCRCTRTIRRVVETERARRGRALGWGGAPPARRSHRRGATRTAITAVDRHPSRSITGMGRSFLTWSRWTTAVHMDVTSWNVSSPTSSAERPDQCGAWHTLLSRPSGRSVSKGSGVVASSVTWATWHAFSLGDEVPAPCG